jgi:hypothetical protein
LDYPEALVIWEEQYGDFCNAAQVIIDQFVASAESKWQWLSGLVMLLPHGYEGQWPEYSSARVERWLLMAAEHNLQLVFPTTPAQYFHCLRRQVLHRWRKPLIVFTPKRRRCWRRMPSLRRGAASMTLAIKIPTVGESIQEVEIVQWLKQEGQWVEQDEEIVEIDTDKVSRQIAAPAAGRMITILKQAGEHAEIGDTIAELDETAKRESSPKAVEPSLPRQPLPAAPEERTQSPGANHADEHDSPPHRAATCSGTAHRRPADHV